MEIFFKWIGGATFILMVGNLKIAVDPVLCEKGTIQDYFWFKSRRIENPVYSDKDFDNIDLWLITHNHEDHLDKLGLTKIKEPSILISNKNAAHILEKNHKKNIYILKWKENKTLHLKDFSIKITAIPAIHGINPLSALFAGKGNGYLLEISRNNETFVVYITGDTVYKNKSLKNLKGKKIDLLVPNMGAAKKGSWIMTLTLDSKMLKKMINELQPKKIIPVHYGTFEHYKEPENKIKEIKDPRILFLEKGKAFKIHEFKSI